MGMKYIVVKVHSKLNETSREWPIIFPDALVHRQVADIVQDHLAIDLKQDSRAIAAGSISFFGGQVRCFGESETLNLESRGTEDEKLIKMFDYLHGIV